MPKMHKLRIVSTVAILLLSAFNLTALLTDVSAQGILADTQYKPSGNSIINVPADFLTIQLAINAAKTGDKVYVAAGTYYENVVIKKDNITLIGQGQNETIIDAKVLGTACKIEASNVCVSGFSFKNSDYAGILLDHSFGCEVFNNTATGNKYGIYLTYSNDCLVYDNRAFNNEWNILTEFSANNSFTYNKMEGYSYNFGLRGWSLNHYSHKIDTSNTVNGKPIYYIANADNIIVNNRTYPSIGCLIIVNSSRITIEGLSLSNNVDGILLAYVSDSNAKYVTSIGNKVGINLEYCSNCEVSNSVTEEDMFDGIVLSGSSHCEIYQNNITGNYRGIYLTGTYNSTVHDNLIANNFQAGIVFDHALGNIFFHNNIVKNAIQLDASDSQKDSFDNVFKENYWSDYDGSDTDMDGIGNTLVPHQLDNFPLVGQYSKFDVKKENAVYQVEIISSSFPSDLKIDQGTKSLRFKLSAMGGIGFARIVLPYALLDGPFTIIVDEMLPLLVDTKSSGAFAQLYFVYPEGNCTAEIVGENATVLIAHAGSDTWASTGTPVLFNASKSVSNRGIRNFEWDFGDGTTGSGANVTHYYAEPGNYTSVLTIMDTEGNTAKDSAMVSVGSTLESKNPIIIPRWLVLGGLITICGVVAFSVGEKLIKRKRNKFPQVENHLTTDSKV